MAHKGPYTHLIIENAEENPTGAVERLQVRKAEYETVNTLALTDAQLARHEAHYTSVVEAITLLQQ